MVQLLFHRFSLRPEYSWREFEAINASIPGSKPLAQTHRPGTLNLTRAQRSFFLKLL